MERNKNKLKQKQIENMEQINSGNSDENQKNKQLLEKYKNDQKELKKTLRACNEKLVESQKAIESNQRVISYLNKQLNDSAMNNNIFSKQYGLGTAQHSTPSSLQYQSPYLNKISPINPITPNIGMGAAVSPILNSNNNNNALPVISSNINSKKTSPPSSYFPQ